MVLCCLIFWSLSTWPKHGNPNKLYDYQIFPSGYIENTSDLLKGERVKLGPISDLDRFFERLYNYYCEKGLWCIVTQWIVEISCLGFTIGVSSFILLFLDW